MTPRPSRPKLNTVQSWEDYEREQRHTPKGKRADLRALRRAVYAEIEAARGRPLFVYFADTEDPFKAELSSVDFRDIDGFIDLIGESRSAAGVDVLLHSDGGSGEATERIVEILRHSFDEVHFLIPHSAYSAATMLALSGDSITLHPSAALGPTDPQINGAPAASVLNGFEHAKKAIKADPALIPAYVPMIQKYSLPMLERCNDAANLSKDLARAWLKRFMFKEQGSAATTALIEKAVNYFSDYNKHLTHARPLHWRAINDMGLNINLADGKLAALLREAYILLRGFFSVSRYAKLYESADFSFGHLIPAPPRLSPQAIERLLEELEKSPPAPAQEDD